MDAGTSGLRGRDDDADAEDAVTTSLETGARDSFMGLEAIDEGWEPFSASGARPVATGAASATGASAAAHAVTLIVYGWKMVEPGTLWWVFPSVSTALAAARAMTNAVKWAIVQGPPKGAIVDIGRARAAGSVLVEQGA
jgi:hypothetical protein